MVPLRRMVSAVTSVHSLTACMTSSPRVAGSTEHGSAAFYEFMEAIAGPRVKLQGFQHFRGGLDVTSKSAATKMGYCVFHHSRSR